MVRCLPIESCSLNHQYLLFQEKIEEKLLVIVDFIFLHIDFREEVDRAHWLDTGDTWYGLKGLIGSLALFIQPSSGRSQLGNTLVTAECRY
jgi:hypothetical protein